MAETLEQLVQRLCRRDEARAEATVQADVRQLLLTAPFHLEDEQVVTLEAQVGDRRRIDVEVGATVIEVKRDLRVGNVLLDAVAQLQGYVAARQERFGGRYVGVLTDGAEWRCYHLDRGTLVEVSSLTLAPAKPDVAALLVWVEGVLATAKGIKPTPEAIQTRLGAGSSAHHLDRATLAALYDEHRDAPTVRTKRRLWARLLATALGTQFEDDDALFIEHTLLVNSAEVIAHAVLGIPLESVAASSLLSGAKFDEAGIFGVVEADFFDWVVTVPRGEAFVRTLARRLARFEWGAVDRDVLKVLYESVIVADTRKKLGEYYTPDWLAQQVVEAVVDAPLQQRVLDPSCGSGTFLFHAVRRYLDAAERAKVRLADALAGLTRHVLGMDLHPVAVTFARVTYVLAIGRERLTAEDRGVLHVPVYLGDSMLWRREPRSLLSGAELTLAADDAAVSARDPLVPRQLVLDGQDFQQVFRFPSALLKDARAFDQLVSELAKRASQRVPGSPFPALKGLFQRLGVAADVQAAVTSTFQMLCRLHDEGRDHIWGYYIRNMARPEWLARAENHVDVLVGNPPWLSYRFMPEAMQQRFRELCEARGLWQGGKVATQQDLSALFIARVMQLYLADRGRFGFVMPDAVLDRGQFAGFRGGTLGEPNDPVCAAFETPWDLRRVRPHFFPREAAVVFGRRAASATPMPAAAEVWKGKLPARGSTWDAVAKHLHRDVGTGPAAPAGEASPYTGRFRQGATLVPRVLFMVERLPAGALGMPFGKARVRSATSATEKPPWKDLPRLEGVVETEFLRPVHLGETVLPYRTLGARTAVLPVDAEAILDPAGDTLDEFPGLATWWREANHVWERLRSSERLSLSERLDFHRELTSQFPIAPLRVVYAKAGMHLAAARVVDHRAIIDHTLYWATVATKEEAHFLCAILNSVAATQATRPLMSRGKEERHIDTHVWKLPIPAFDVDDGSHVALATLGRDAEALMDTLPVTPADNFVTLRRAARALLAASDVGRHIETLVAPMLPPPWLDEVYALVAAGEGRKALTRVYDEIDERLLDGHDDAVDWILNAVDVTRLDTAVALGFLSVSLQAGARLHGRPGLVARVEAWLRAREPARVERLMEGLR